MRIWVRIAFLTGIWVLLWGDLSAANVLSGVALSVLLLLLYPYPQAKHDGLNRPRPVAIIRLLAYIAGQVAISNVLLTREILTRRSRIRAGVVACRLHTRSTGIITFLANVLSLSPGTMPVEVQTEPPIIYIHVLYLHDPVEARRSVAKLERLTVRAFGNADDIARLAIGAEVKRAPLGDQGASK